LNDQSTEMDFLADVLLRGSISEVLPQVVRADVADAAHPHELR